MQSKRGHVRAWGPPGVLLWKYTARRAEKSGLLPISLRAATFHFERPGLTGGPSPEATRCLSSLGFAHDRHAGRLGVARRVSHGIPRARRVRSRPGRTRWRERGLALGRVLEVA